MKKSTATFQGVMPALITPLTKEGKLNKTVLKQLIEDLIAKGADGFYIGGATGEGLVLSANLHKELTRESIAIVNGRVPCIIHVARMIYSEMIELAQYAEQQGAAAISAIPPLFYKYGDDGIYDYYKGLCDSVNIPVVIYNNPNTGVTFSVDLLKRLFSIENLTSIKWTTYDFYSVMRLKSVCPDASVINGPDEMVVPGLSAGCDACIGTTYNFQLPIFKKIYNAFHAGNLEEARALQIKVCNIVGILAKYDVIMGTKVVLSRQGYDVNYPIYPMQAMSREDEDKMMAELLAAGLEL